MINIQCQIALVLILLISYPILTNSTLLNKYKQHHNNHSHSKKHNQHGHHINHKNIQVKNVSTSKQFGHALFNRLGANNVHIDKCIPAQWNEANGVLDKNSEFNNAFNSLKRLKYELKNYKKFFNTGGNINLECHYSGVVKHRIINEFQSKGNDHHNDPKIHGGVKVKVKHFIQMYSKNENNPNNNKNNHSTPTPTHKKKDTSGGKVLKFLESNFQNFDNNILNFTSTNFFNSLKGMCVCLQPKTKNADFNKMTNKLITNLSHIQQYGIKAKIVLGVNSVCYWSKLKKALTDLENGLANKKEKWAHIAMAVANLIEIFSL